MEPITTGYGDADDIDGVRINHCRDRIAWFSVKQRSKIRVSRTRSLRFEHQADVHHMITRAAMRPRLEFAEIAKIYSAREFPEKLVRILIVVVIARLCLPDPSRPFLQIGAESYEAHFPEMVVRPFGDSDVQI